MRDDELLLAPPLSSSVVVVSRRPEKLEQYFIVSRRDTQEGGGSRNYKGSSRPSVKVSTLFSIALAVSFALLFHNAHVYTATY